VQRVAPRLRRGEGRPLRRLAPEHLAPLQVRAAPRLAPRRFPSLDT